MSPAEKKDKFQTNAIRVSAPGRVGLIGGYSILDKGNTSYSFTVDARVHAYVITAGTIRIKAPQFRLDTTAVWKDGTLRFEQDVPAAAFAKAALQAVFEYLEFKKIAIRPFELETRSDPAFNQGGGKSGLGSSAAATVAMVHGALLHHGVNDLKITHHAAQVAHCRAQGKVGSGYDVAASVFGSQEYQRFTPAFIDGFPANADKPWDYFVRPLPVPQRLHFVLGAFQEGASTPGMVKLVGAWKKEQPKKYADLMQELDDANVDTTAYMEQLHTENTEENRCLFRDFFEAGRALTRQLGENSGAPIEPADVQKLIDESMERGAFVCKAPGAGGKDNLVAFCLTEKDAQRLKAFWKKEGLTLLDVAIQNEGVLHEKAQSVQRGLTAKNRP